VRQNHGVGDLLADQRNPAAIEPIVRAELTDTSSTATTQFGPIGAPQRRLFAQELTTQLRRVGAASLHEMEHEFRLKLFKVDASNPELLQAAHDARRFGWVAAPDCPDEGEWSLTQSGAVLPRPTSLATAQIGTRILHAINPVREGAANLLPYLALAAGGVAAFKASVSTLTAVRVIAIGILVWTFAIQLVGEARIVQLVSSWPKLRQDSDQRARHRAVLRFYSWGRFAFNVAFLTAIVGAFGLGIFNERDLFVKAFAGACVLGLPLAVLSLQATREVSSRRAEQPRPPAPHRPPS